MKLVGSLSTKRCLRSMSMSAMASEQESSRQVGGEKRMDPDYDSGANLIGINTYLILDDSHVWRSMEGECWFGRRALGGEETEVGASLRGFT